MDTWSRLVAGVLFLAASGALSFAGGSGLNVAVVANAASPQSLQLANYYCEKRQVPPQNVIYINWPGTNTGWTLAGDYQTVLLNPLLAAIAERGLTNQIEYVVLSMDIPYRINGGVDGVNSTTSALFYGFKSDPRNPFTCPLATNSESAYAGSEGVFRKTPPVNAASNSYLATMITASNLALAKQIVDSGTLADGTFPTQAVHLIKTFDGARNVRFALFDDAIFNTRVRGGYSLRRTNLHEASNLGEIFGFQTGRATLSINGTTFVPGSIADSLTSYGGALFDGFGQTHLLVFLEAGAAGSYGTVVEPCNFLEKFPIPQIYFYQGRGFSLAECFYQSIANPYEGITVGEPLSAPFAQPCDGSWSNLPPAPLLSGTTNLSVQFTAADPTRPVQQVDLFLDGIFLKTLTNIVPSQDNVLYVTLPSGTNISFAIPTNATIASVASGLAGELNILANSDATKVGAFVFGDRIELRSAALNRTGSETFVSTSNSVGSAPALTTFVHASRADCLDTFSAGIRAFEVEGVLVPGDILQLDAMKTNGASVTVTVTNTLPGGAVTDIAQQLLMAINTTLALQGPDGLIAEDLIGSSTNYAAFNLRARSIGLSAGQIQLSVTGTFKISPTNTVSIAGNLSDLQPRNHLYVTAGVTNLPLTFPLVTTNIADGWHELTAVAYEGSHVRTQKRVAQTVLVQNTALSAVFDCLACDGNVGLDGALQFSVSASTNTITRIELFSTGGSWGVVSNQPSAFFSVAATNLHLGLHPFYALVTRDDSKQYRTETRWIRIEPSFALNITGSEPTLSWPAETGTLYEVLSATNVTETFQLRDSLTATNSTAQWSETNDAAPQQFYRVRTQP